MSGGQADLRLTAIIIYPIKACAGISLEAEVLEQAGLRRDRRWMIVGADGKALTQRDHPRLAHVVPARTGAGWSLSAPGYERVELWAVEEVRELVTVWHDEVDSASCNPESAAWVSDYLATPARFVAMTGADRHATVDGERGGGANGPQERVPVSFADELPLLVLTEASLADLNGRLEQPLSMANFRPNLVIAGAGPFAEDDWRVITIGEARIKLEKPCGRCVVTTIDPETAEPYPGQEPLRTLATYRRTTPPSAAVNFGQRACVQQTGRLRVGEHVTVFGASTTP